MIFCLVSKNWWEKADNYRNVFHYQDFSKNAQIVREIQIPQTKILWNNKNEARENTVTGWTLTELKKWWVLKYQSKGNGNFRISLDTMEGFCFVISLRGISRLNTGENDDNDLKWSSFIVDTDVLLHIFCSILITLCPTVITWHNYSFS